MTTSNEPIILKETTHWVALNKPPSLVVHDVPGEKHAGETLVDWLRATIPAIDQNFSKDDTRPGIVHRLDADTSGVILVAKDPQTLQALQDQFRERSTAKIYQALVLGHVQHAGELIGNIARTGNDTEHTVKRLSFSWDKHEAKPAETSYRPLSHYIDTDQRQYTLLELRPKTGRTHQLRVQLLDAGWPIIGDQQYATKASRDASQSLNLKRQFLHAVSLTITDPETQATTTISSKLANDLATVRDQLTNTPVPLLIVGPSGVGKSTIIEQIALLFPQLVRFKTTTTRAPRHTGDDRYHFVTQDEFRQMVGRDEFLEWTETHGNLYGTERRVIQEILDQQKYPLPSNAIDIKGVEAYKHAFPHLLAIFIAYDSLDQLPDRIRKTRPETTEAEIDRRMTTAREEMAAIDHFDHVVYNHEGRVEQATKEVVAIITTSLGLTPSH